MFEMTVNNLDLRSLFTTLLQKTCIVMLLIKISKTTKLEILINKINSIFRS